MKRLDLLKLRKNAGLSQKELADRLSVQPSFLSAIENGRSRFPEEKLDRLKEILLIDDLEEFMVDDGTEVPVVPPHTHLPDETDAISRLLRHIHNLAHKEDGADKSRENDLLDRVEFLSRRNDRLSDRLDDLREQLDALRDENFRLKELLLKNNISF